MQVDSRWAIYKNTLTGVTWSTWSRIRKTTFRNNWYQKYNSKYMMMASYFHCE